MTTIRSLHISHLRNIESARLDEPAMINILCGENGSGKTSILEAIYLLGLARSFRSSSVRPMIAAGSEEAVVSGRLQSGLVLGVKKTSQGKQEVRVGGKAAGSAAELASELPIQLLNSDTFAILDGPPNARRSFLDWGVFHVEPLFIGNWRHTLKSLHQRNALLKRGASRPEIEPWSQELARYGEKIDAERTAYIQPLLDEIDSQLALLLPEIRGHLSIAYSRGWPADESLIETLHRVEERDRRQGHSTNGPHRADLKLIIDGVPAVERLSRGQQKLMICAMKLAQTALLRRLQQRACVFLLDDLAAELDAGNRGRVCAALEAQQQQVFMTCIDAEQIGFSWENKAQVRLFHVKHGKISAFEEGRNP